MLASTTQSPYINKTILASAIGARVIDSRLELAIGRIPCRILFELENGDRFEHIFQAETIKSLDRLEPIVAKDLAADLSLSRSSLISELTITTRKDPQSKWQLQTIYPGQHRISQLVIRGLHKRVDRTTNAPYQDDNGREILHAKYCYFKC